MERPKRQFKKPISKPKPVAKQGDIPTFPMRINKFLAHNKQSTRRGADELIKKKQVFINGKVAVLGDKVNANDTVEVKFRGKPTPHIYIAYNKPKGIVTHSAGKGEKEIKHVFSMRDVFPIGRLDKESEGLIIMTNDGRITERLLSPEYFHEKEYLVSTKNKLRPSFKDKMEAGVQIDNEHTAPCKVKIINDHEFKIILTEGKKHQIRRMCVALFQEVDSLKRIRVMNIQLGALKSGGHRKIVGEELEKFLIDLGMK